MSTTRTQPSVSQATAGSGRRTWVTWGVGGGVVLLAAWGAFALIGSRAPAPDGKPEEVARYVASERFADLPHDRQRAYIEALDWEKLRELPPEDRRATFRVIGEFRERDTVMRYMRMTPEERRKHLDEVIQAEQQRRAEREQRRAQGQEPRPEGFPPREGRPAGEGQNRPPPGGGPGRNSPEREKARLENRDPALRAAIAQYRADLAQRRAELGLPGGPGGGGGWGRGPR